MGCISAECGSLQLLQLLGCCARLRGVASARLVLLPLYLSGGRSSGKGSERNAAVGMLSTLHDTNNGYMRLLRCLTANILHILRKRVARFVTYSFCASDNGSSSSSSTSSTSTTIMMLCLRTCIVNHCALLQKRLTRVALMSH